MASPRLLYYAEKAAAQPSLKPAPRPLPEDLHAAEGVTKTVGMSLAVWAAIILLFLVVVYQ